MKKRPEICKFSKRTKGELGQPDRNFEPWYKKCTLVAKNYNWSAVSNDACLKPE